MRVYISWNFETRQKVLYFFLLFFTFLKLNFSSHVNFSSLEYYWLNLYSYQHLCILLLKVCCMNFFFIWNTIQCHKHMFDMKIVKIESGPFIIWIFGILFHRVAYQQINSTKLNLFYILRNFIWIHPNVVKEDCNWMTKKVWIIKWM